MSAALASILIASGWAVAALYYHLNRRLLLLCQARQVALQVSMDNTDRANDAAAAAIFQRDELTQTLRRLQRYYTEPHAQELAAELARVHEAWARDQAAFREQLRRLRAGGGTFGAGVGCQ